MRPVRLSHRLPAVFLASALLSAALRPAFGDSLFPLDRLRLNILRLQAIDTAVMLYIGWVHDDPSGFKQEAQKAVQDCRDILSQDESLNPPPEFKELLGSQERAIRKQIALYQGIESKDEAALKEGYRAFNDDLQVLYNNMDAAVESWEKARHYTGDQVPLEEEVKCSPDPSATKAYRDGVEFIRAKKYGPALQDLNPLLKKYEGTPFGACAGLRASDALALGADTPSTPTPRAKKDDSGNPALDLLEKLEKKDLYSPVAFETFLKWRTLEQEEHHGMSNFSDIPNNEYNKERERWLAIVREYQKTHPQDAWAEVQAETFLIQPNIDRGEAYGNSNLSFWGTLYMDPRYYYDKPKKDGK